MTKALLLAVLLAAAPVYAETAAPAASAPAASAADEAAAVEKIRRLPPEQKAAMRRAIAAETTADMRRKKSSEYLDITIDNANPHTLRYTLTIAPQSDTGKMLADRQSAARFKTIAPALAGSAACIRNPHTLARRHATGLTHLNIVYRLNGKTVSSETVPFTLCQ